MIKILDSDFKILDTITRYSSVTWTKRFYEGGSFSVQLSKNTDIKTDLDKKLICHKGNYGIIQYLGESSASVPVIKGYDLKSILSFRQGKGDYTGKLETVIKSIVSDNTEGNRSFPHFVIAEDLKRGPEVAYNFDKSASVENMLKTICEAEGVGYDVIYKEGNIVFDVIFPKTINHTEIFRNGNIQKTDYAKNQLQLIMDIVKRFPLRLPRELRITHAR